MSATVWHTSESAGSVRRLSQPASATLPRPHRHLISVPTGDAVPEPVQPRLRLTRRGRLVLLVAAAAVGAVVALVLAIAVATGSAASAADHAVTVQPGQTLSEIALREMPGLAMREAVARIQIANDLPSSHVSAGQSLVIPKY
jgi:hypothetical protein